MKRFILSFLLLSLLFISEAFPQTAKQYAVQISATVQSSAPQITLHWVPETGVSSYTIWRKMKDDGSWTTLLGTLPDTATQFIDTNVTVGKSYEYKVQKSAAKYAGYGYINAGIEVPATEDRGKLILVVDTSFISYFRAELDLCILDMTGDGWTVTEIGVDRNDSVPDVKAQIQQMYTADPLNTKALYLFGHVPVPYSGNLNPDGHPDHQGAWPADVYYGDMDGNWTDFSINNTVASQARNDNIPGDGKFDQTAIPSDVELQVGRVDFANLPAFADSEQELLRRYLVKAHAYKHKIFSPSRRALIDDHFGGFSGEAFAASAWKNFPAIVGANAIDTYDYDDTLSKQSYLWSYGCGGGSYTSCSGVVTTARFSTDSMQTVFTVLFGSYFGDWDSNNNLLRAALASGTTLTDFWSGRPHWQFHHMALGENIGYAARLTQNNNSLYSGGYGTHWIHIALMGDPTLRSQVVAPPSGLQATFAASNLSWTPSPEPVLGYVLYRKDPGSSGFQRVSASVISGNSYIDTSLALNGEVVYMVRALRLDTTGSGTFYTMSQGAFDTVISTIGLPQSGPQAELSFSVFPNPSEGRFSIGAMAVSEVMCKLEVLNAEGRLIYSESLLVGPSGMNRELELYGLKGLYFVRLSDQKGWACIRKIVVM